MRYFNSYNAYNNLKKRFYGFDFNKPSGQQAYKLLTEYKRPIGYTEVSLLARLIDESRGLKGEVTSAFVVYVIMNNFTCYFPDTPKEEGE